MLFLNISVNIENGELRGKGQFLWHNLITMCLKLLQSNEEGMLDNYFTCKEPYMYDLLIGTAGYHYTAFVGSHNKDDNYYFIPLPRHDEGE